MEYEMQNTIQYTGQNDRHEAFHFISFFGDLVSMSTAATVCSVCLQTTFRVNYIKFDIKHNGKMNTFHLPPQMQCVIFTALEYITYPTN